jgi:hypothetical protein
MKISEYIAELQKLQDEHGDLEVNGYSDRRIVVKNPKIRFVKILSKRESCHDFWESWDNEDKKGEKVVEI